MQIQHTKPNRSMEKIQFAVILVATVAAAWIAFYSPEAQGESLFRGQANYSAAAPMTPHSLFTQPRPQFVGDNVTIMVNEVATLQTQGELKINRDQNLNENSTTLFNTILHNLGFAKRWSIPTLNGLDNTQTISSKAETKRSSQLTDTVTCQVVQVLPNGHLVVQGHKRVMMNKEQQDMFVTGIVNPFYIDRHNQIDSNRVANFQMLAGGQGTVSRQQNDGIMSKVYQYLN